MYSSESATEEASRFTIDLLQQFFSAPVFHLMTVNTSMYVRNMQCNVKNKKYIIFLLCLCRLYLLVTDQHNGMKVPKYSY